MKKEEFQKVKKRAIKRSMYFMIVILIALSFLKLQLPYDNPVNNLLLLIIMVTTLPLMIYLLLVSLYDMARLSLSRVE